eukprot:TRINITY_DN39265_c0_g1_i1.p3 TRINITY_DN39265_c0_g1~~TRINITY_DN39265_c0_g1_i1.p3  ORF type:complete len:113 (+),score=8.58 TRINITY_DN39265_c0_g1_i1:356-694(+)
MGTSLKLTGVVNFVAWQVEIKTRRDKDEDQVNLETFFFVVVIVRLFQNVVVEEEFIVYFGFVLSSCLQLLVIELTTLCLTRFDRYQRGGSCPSIRQLDRQTEALEIDTAICI